MLRIKKKLPSHCRRGHKLSRETVMMDRNGVWRCLQCRRMSDSRREHTDKNRTKTCLRCGKVFHPFRTRSAEKYCSRQCYFVAVAPRKILLECFQCKKEFSRLSYRNRYRRVFCSNLCRWAWLHSMSNPLKRSASDLQKHHHAKEWRCESRAWRKKEPKCAVCQKKATTVDHIVGFSIIRHFASAMEPDSQINYMSLCRPCHIIKTHADRHLYQGDLLRFRGLLNSNNWPMDRVESALKYYGFVASASHST